MYNSADPETRIHLALGKILRYFNFLDLNLGLCLRFLENPQDPEQYHPKLAKMSTQQKLSRLQELIKGHKDLSAAANDQNFAKWFESANKTRAIRNFYAHGTWDYVAIRNNERLSFRVPGWMKSPLGGDVKKTMTIEELENSANEVEEVFSRFMSLRRKHGI